MSLAKELLARLKAAVGRREPAARASDTAGGDGAATYGADESAVLAAGVERFRGALSARGFAYSNGDQGVSSGGAFGVGFFRRGPLEIGLIVRGSGLGCPNYSVGNGYAGHAGLIEALGAGGTERLIKGEWVAFKARDGGDPFEALRHDLEEIVLPALDASEARFLETVQRAADEARAALLR